MNRFATRWLRLAGLALLVAGSAPAQAQYPNHPIRLIVPYAAGTAADALARVLGDRLGGTLGQPLVVDNRPGAGANIGTEAAARSPSDGYTLMLATIDLATNPSIYRQVSYDSLKDFVAIAPVARIAGLLVVPADSPAKTLHELVALAKARPGVLNFASGGNGTQAHFAGVMFAQAAGINVVHVPYRGASDMVGSLLSSQTAFAFPTFVTVLPLVQSGKLRALAVTSPARNPKLPNVPTMKEAMPPGIELNAWFGLVGPAGMSPQIVNRLNAETTRILNDPAMRDKLEADGTKVFTGTPAEFSTLIRSDYARWAEIVKKTDIHVD